MPEILLVGNNLELLAIAVALLMVAPTVCGLIREATK
jgi:hypothetical protein